MHSAHSARLAVAAIAVAGGVGLSAAPASAAAVHPETVGCFYTFNADGVYIRSVPDGLPVLGEGYVGQTFFSYPETVSYAGGLYWVKGTDEATGVSGWSAEEYLSESQCHNY